MPLRLSLIVGTLVAVIVGLADTAANQTPTPAPRIQRSDRIVLKSGRIVEGMITQADERVVTLAFDFGGSVEFKRTDVRRVVRGEGERKVAPRVPDGRRGIDWRYLLYHGEEAVGFRTFRRKPAARKRGLTGTMMRDEVSFLEMTPDGPVPCRVVTIEFVSDDRRVRTLYYRETGLGTDYIVDGTWKDGQLEYTWFRAGRRTYHRQTVPADVSFPLSFWCDTNDPKRPAGATRLTLWDPKAQRATQVSVTRSPPLAVTVGEQKLRITPITVTGRRGLELRWVAPDGTPMKEVLNGRSLVSVLTRFRSFPKRIPKQERPDRRETGFARVLLCPSERVVVSVPQGGWMHVPDPIPGVVLTLRNEEMDALITVYWRAGDGWPGPAPSTGVKAKPIVVAGWPGEGWQETMRGRERSASPSPKRVRTVRRTRTAAGGLAVVLEAPEEMMPPAYLDLSHVLRGCRFPGRR